MSKIDKFYAKAQEIELAGEKYMLKPFTVEDMPLLTRLSSREPAISSKAQTEVIFKILKQIDSEIKEEDIKNVAMEYVEQIMDAVAKLNNIDLEEAKEKLLKENGN